MTPAVRASRGTKRHCQNDACGRPFYDLNHTDITCPNCSTGFVPPPPEPPRAERGRYARSFNRAPLRIEPALEPSPLEEPVADQPVADVGDGQEILEIDQDDDGPLPLEVEQEGKEE